MLKTQASLPTAPQGGSSTGRISCKDSRPLTVATRYCCSAHPAHHLQISPRNTHRGQQSEAPPARILGPGPSLPKTLGAGPGQELLHKVARAAC